MHIFLYGPPGSGKTSLGKALAERLDLPFTDLDDLIQKQASQTIPEIFAVEGESGFRRRELAALREIFIEPPGVIALGGGALLNPQAQEEVMAHGQVLCLTAGFDTLLTRLASESEARPLLAGDPAERLSKLLAERAGHYAAFPLSLDTTGLTLAAITQAAQRLTGVFRVRGMGKPYDVRINTGGLEHLGELFRERGLMGPVALVSDQNVGKLYLQQAEASCRAAGYAVESFCIEPGEAHKTIGTVVNLWNFFIQAGVERGSTIAALGGGVTGDLTGFAAATFLRGVNWVNLPTSLLAMVDSSLGGKTGIDLPQAKNLVGAFHAPRLVLADPGLLATLPERELRNGLAEVVKHGIIADPDLFNRCGQGWQAVTSQIDGLVRQAMAVKLAVIEADPYEQGARQALNLGHTIGHGVELASDFKLSHGEAVAVGTVAEARLAETIGLAERGLAETIAAVLANLGLPVTIPTGLSADRIIDAMQHDKKRAAGKIRFALPVGVGTVRTGVEIADWPELLRRNILNLMGEK